MKLLRLLIATLALISVSYAQSNVAGDRFFHGVLDGTSATSTRPFRTGTVLPGSCAGDEWFVLKSGNAKTIYYCSGTVFAQYSVSTGGSGGLSAPASNGLMSYAGSNTTMHAALSDVTALTGTGPTAATNLGLATVAGSGLSTSLADSNLLVHQDSGGNVTVNGNVNSGGGGSADGSVSTFGATSGQVQLTGKTSSNIFTQTVDDNTAAWNFKWPTSGPSQNGMALVTNTDGSSSWVNPVVPTTTTFQGLQNNGTSLITTLPVVEAASLGIVCDGSFDNTTAFVNPAAANHAIHLPDGAICKGRVSDGVSNTRWFCKGCSISHLTSDTGDNDVYLGFKNDITYEGIAFDDAGTNHQSFAGGTTPSSAQTTLLTASGGSGWQANYRVGFSISGGGCTSNANGYFTTNSSGVPNAVFLYNTGFGCTSVPTTFNISTYCGDGITGCVAPTLTWQAGLTPQAATTNQAMIYLNGDQRIKFVDCTLRSTGASVSNLASNIDGFKSFSSGAILDHLKIENTIVGEHIYNDSNAKTDRQFVVKDPDLNGSMIDGIQMKGHPGNTLVYGGSITMQSPDPFAGSGQNGNGISIFDTDSNTVHDITITNPDFSGLRITGDSNFNSTKPTSNNNVYNVTIAGNQEMGAWVELGAEFNYLTNITVKPSTTQSSAGCISGTNTNQRPHYGYNYFTNIHCIGQQGLGVVVEHEVVVNPTTVDVAVPYRIGFGCTSNGVVIRGATSTVTGKGYSTPSVMFALDRCNGGTSATKGTNYLQFNTQPDYPFGGTATVPIAYIDFANFPLIGGVTASNPAVISYIPTTDTSWPFSVGSTYMLEGIYGALNASGQSLNGRLCGVTAINTTSHTITCGGVTGVPPLDSTGYLATPFTLSPAGRGNGMFYWVYQSGNTTPAWSANSLMNVTNAF